HLAPVEHLVALGDDGEVSVEPCQHGGGHGAQLVDISRLEMEMLVAVPSLDVAYVALQVARGVHRRVEDNGRAVEFLCQHCGVEASERTADERHPVSRPGREPGS